MVELATAASVRSHVNCSGKRSLIPSAPIKRRVTTPFFLYVHIMTGPNIPLDAGEVNLLPEVLSGPPGMAGPVDAPQE